MLSFDGHADVLTDLTNRRLAGEREIFRTRHLEKLQRGGVGALISVVWIDPPYDKDPSARMLQVLRSGFADLSPLDQIAFPVRSHRELREAVDGDKLAIILGMEGLSGLEDDPDGIYLLHALGVRHASLTWNEGNAFGTGVRATQSEKGLTPSGRQVVRNLEKLGMLVDVSHADEKTFWDVLETASGPVMASHSNAWQLCPHPRNLKDEQIQAIAATGGTIGFNAWPEFVDSQTPSIDRLLDHVDYLAELVGTDHLAFGFDFVDFLEDDSLSSFKSGTESGTPGLKSAEDLPGFLQAMKARGYQDADAEKICYGNLERLFQKVVG